MVGLGQAIYFMVRFGFRACSFGSGQTLTTGNLHGLILGRIRAAFGPHLGRIWATFEPHSGRIQATFRPHLATIIYEYAKKTQGVLF